MKLDATIESYLSNLIQPHFNFSVEKVTEKDSFEKLQMMIDKNLLTQ